MAALGGRDSALAGGSDGERSADRTKPRYKIADAPPLRLVGASQRAASSTPRKRRLSNLDRVMICKAAATGYTLRELAAEYDVSYETIRQALRAGAEAAA